MKFSTVRNRRGRWLMPVLLAVGLAVTGHVAHAQVLLNFQRITRAWPTIELTFTAAYNGQPVYFTDKKYFKVFEDGLEIPDFTLWCPSPTVRCAMSMSMVFDASGAMSGSPLVDAKGYGHHLLTLMSGLDESAILAFTNVATEIQSMTMNLDSLGNAIDNIQAGGSASAVWDGIYTGLVTLGTKAVNPCRALVVFTNGADNASSHTVSQCISYANQNRLRIFTIGIGPGIQAATLQNIADLTGGRYYQNPNPAQLTAIYQEISTIIFTGFQSCTVTYTAQCMDGGMRTVDLSIVDFHGGSDTKSKTYKAMRDTTGFKPLRIQLGSALLRGNQVTTIPLELLDPVTPRGNLYPAKWTVQYDRARLQFLGIERPPGSLLENVPVTITQLPGGVQFETEERKIVDVPLTPATLMHLRFKASDPEGRDTVICPLTLKDWEFEAGCYRAVLKDGEIRIVPRQAVVSCVLVAPPAVEWSIPQSQYLPSSFTVQIAAANAGDREARNARFIIDFDKEELALVAPSKDTLPGAPVDLAPAASQKASWDLRARNRLTSDSVRVCVTAIFENHDSIRTCAKIWIPQADAALSCAASAQIIAADMVNQRYLPMPFDVTVVARNEGGKPAEGLSARIVLPPELTLYGPDVQGREKKNLEPSVLIPGTSTEAHWTLWHKPIMPAAEYTVGFWITATNTTSSYCETKILIPALEAPNPVPECTAPDSLSFNAAKDMYEPNPFTVTLSCVNLGNRPAANVTAFVYLPADVVAADSTETLRKAYPSPMPEWKPGDPVQRVSWKLRYKNKPRQNSELEFRFAVGGRTSAGLPLDSVQAWGRIRIPGLTPEYACRIIAPDSLGRNAQETNVEPNPFTITYQVWNSSRQSARIVRLELEYPPGEGLTLDASTPRIRYVNRQLLPNDTVAAVWQVHVQNRSTRRDVMLRCVAFDDDGRAIACGHALTIANPRLALVSLLTPSSQAPDSLHFNVSRDSFDPNPFRVTLNCLNSGAYPASNVSGFLYLPADVELANPLDSLRKFFPSPMNEWKPGDPIPGVSWVLRYMKKPRYDTYLEFRFVLGGLGAGGLPVDSVVHSCRVLVPGLAPSFACRIEMPDSLHANAAETQVEPNPFTVKYRIWNTSLQHGIIDRVELVYSPEDELVLDSWSPRSRIVNMTLAPADTLTVSWNVHAQNRLVRRDVSLRGMSYDNEGNVFESRDTVSIANVKSLLSGIEAAVSGHGFMMLQNKPNPFNRSTVIDYEVPVASPVQIAVYDVFGRTVRVLVDRVVPAGRHSVTFDADALPSGIYLYRMETQKYQRIMKLILSR